MNKIFALLAIAVVCYAYLNYADAASPSASFMKKIPTNSTYSEYWFSYGNYNYLPVGASYYSQMSGYAQYGLQKKGNKVLVGTWRFPINTTLACRKNSWLSPNMLANLYDYSGVCK